MNKFYFAATAAVALITADADGFPRRRYFNKAKPRKASPVNADPTLTEEKALNPDRQQSPIHDLLAQHPHVIAASLFTRKPR